MSKNDGRSLIAQEQSASKRMWNILSKLPERSRERVLETLGDSHEHEKNQEKLRFMQNLNELVRSEAPATNGAGHDANGSVVEGPFS